MNKSAWLFWGTVTLLGFSCLNLTEAQTLPKTGEPIQPTTALNNLIPVKSPAELAAGKSKRAVRREQKKEMKQVLETIPVLVEIQKLKWDEASIQAQSNDTKRIGLEKIFSETLQNSISVRQAEVQINDAEAQAKEIRDPNLFNLLNPLDIPSMKKAAENNVEAAKAHLKAARQKALLESAKMYADLTQAFLGKYLAYQSIEQGRSQLKAEQEHFIAGETNRFDVTQVQMALIDRYGKYLTADNTYHTASMALAKQLDISTNITLIPEDVALQDGNAAVPPLKLLPDNLTLEIGQKTAIGRPDLQEMRFRKQALEKLIKAASGLDKQKKKGELHQLELEIQKATDGIAVMTEKAYSDYMLGRKNLVLAQQSFELGNQFVYQLQVSYAAGFSSAKDVLDAQIEVAKVKTALIGAQVAYNLSQIQLLYEMGLLSEDVLSHPVPLPTNAL